MKQLRRKLKQLLILFLMLSWQSTLQAQSEITPPNLKCLTRVEKQALEITFEENEQCQRDLRASYESEKSDWLFFSLAMVLGAVAGVVVESQVHHN